MEKGMNPSATQFYLDYLFLKHSQLTSDGNSEYTLNPIYNAISDISFETKDLVCNSTPQFENSAGN